MPERRRNVDGLESCEQSGISNIVTGSPRRIPKVGKPRLCSSGCHRVLKRPLPGLQLNVALLRNGCLACPMDLEHVAKLARIELTEEEKVEFASQFSEILGHMKRLDSLDVAGIEPTAHAFPIVNVLADDVVQPGLLREEALQNAPERNEEGFVVPRVVGG